MDRAADLPLGQGGKRYISRDYAGSDDPPMWTDPCASTPVRCRASRLSLRYLTELFIFMTTRFITMPVPDACLANADRSHQDSRSVPRRRRPRRGLVLALTACVSLAAVSASAQTLSPSDPGFWVVLPDGGRVPYNHPLAAGGPRPAPAPTRTTSAPSSSATLGPADPGFWVVLPNGGRVPYNHPDAIAAGDPPVTSGSGGTVAPGDRSPEPASPPAAPSQALLPSDPGFWVVLPNGGMVPYNHPEAPAATASPAPSRSAEEPPRAPTPVGGANGIRLRVLHWNLHHGVGTDGRYDINRIASWMARMAPDVITLNEVEKNTWWGREDQPARYETLMEQLTGREWHAFFIQELGDWNANGKGHLILSTFPFASTAREAISYNRTIGAAGITVNGRTINVIVTHLDPESHSRRLTQAREVIEWAGTLAENRILTGDMNAWPDQTSIAELDRNYRDSWTDAGLKGAAIQFSGLAPDGATRNGRIDYIFYSRGSGHLAVRRSEVVDTRDSRNAMPSDHRPVVTTFEVR